MKEVNNLALRFRDFFLVAFIGFWLNNHITFRDVIFFSSFPRFFSRGRKILNKKKDLTSNCGKQAQVEVGGNGGSVYYLLQRNNCRITHMNSRRGFLSQKILCFATSSLPSRLWSASHFFSYSRSLRRSVLVLEFNKGKFYHSLSVFGFGFFPSLSLPLPPVWLISCFIPWDPQVNWGYAEKKQTIQIVAMINESIVVIFIWNFHDEHFLLSAFQLR